VAVILLVALGLLATLGRAVFVLASPYAECRWCKNRKQCRLRQHGCLIHRRRCWRCGNTRLARRIGAYHVHKVKQSLQQAWDERGPDE
jgi:hypothetical protein